MVASQDYGSMLQETSHVCVLRIGGLRKFPARRIIDQ
jgi:hypothetical protein